MQRSRDVHLQSISQQKKRTSKTFFFPAIRASIFIIHWDFDHGIKNKLKKSHDGLIKYRLKFRQQNSALPCVTPKCLNEILMQFTVHHDYDKETFSVKILFALGTTPLGYFQY